VGFGFGSRLVLLLQLLWTTSSEVPDHRQAFEQDVPSHMKSLCCGEPQLPPPLPIIEGS